jgi:hypothetical protein
MNIPNPDPLSALAWKIMKADAEAYKAPVVRGGTPAKAAGLMEHVDPAQLLAAPTVDPAAAHGLAAALWLWHDGLDECHRIVQKSPDDYYDGRTRDPRTLSDMTATYALWHAIMHRREGDFSNSRYWYRRAEGHPAYATLSARAGDIINPLPSDKLVFRLVAQGWNPAAFVDLVEAVYDHPHDPKHRLAQSIQEIEWRTLFEHTARAAAGS